LFKYSKIIAVKTATFLTQSRCALLKKRNKWKIFTT
jgi:hypothetical protein